MAEGYMVLSGAGHVQSTDKAAYDITGDIDQIILLAADDWTPTATQVMVSKWAASNRSWLYQLLASSNTQFGHTSDGSTAEFDQSNTPLSTTPGVTDGEHLWLRQVWDANDGGGNHIANYLYSTDPISTAIGSVSWSAHGTADTNAPNTSLFSGTADLYIGANNGGNNYFSGKVYGMWLYSGIPSTVTDPPSGTLIADPDFRTGSWSSGGNDGVGNAWTLAGDATYVPASSPPTGRDITLNFATNTATIDAAI